MISGIKNKNKQKYIIFLCWLVYTCAYIGRYSYNSNIILIESVNNITHKTSGIVTTFFFFAYGIGQVINGLLCKKYNKKYFIFIALFVSSIINIMIFLGISFTYFKYLWLLNGVFQSILWASLIDVLSKNLETINLKRAIIVMATTASAGTLIIYGLSSILSLTGTYKYTFLIASVVMCIVSFVWFFTYSPNTQVIKVIKQTSQKENNPKKAIKTDTKILIIILAIFAVIDNLTKDGLHTWVPAILKETFYLNDSLSIILTLILPLLGVLGAIVATFLNKWIKNYITLASLFFALSVICLIAVVLLIKTPYWWFVLLFFGIIVMFMHATNNVITSMMPIYMRDSTDSAMTAGILNGCCYVGSTISSYGLGAIADSYGWNGVLILLIIVCSLPVTITLILNSLVVIKNKIYKKNIKELI